MRTPVPSRTCLVCGRITEDGTARCAKHKRGGAKSTLCAKCGRLTGGSTYCPEHTFTEEKRRRESQKWREGYRDPDYARNRAKRYELAGGKCEDCGTKLKGRLFPEGQPWECDHVDPLSDGGTNDVANLYCRCLPCHHAKTRVSRRARRDA